MSDGPRYAQGGPIVGAATIRIERLGVGMDGFCVYTVNGKAPESLLRTMNSEALRALLDRRDEP